MPRSIWSIIAILLLVLPSAHAEQPHSHRLRVGAALPLSGAVKFLGDNTLMGMQLYLEQHPSFKDSLVLQIEDTTATTTAGVSAVKKLIEVDKVDALVLEMSPVVNALAPSIDREGIPTIAIVGDDCAADRNFVVKLWLPAAHETKAVALQVQKLGASSLAIVHAEQDSMIARVRALKELLPSHVRILELSVATNDELAIAATKVVSYKPEVAIMNLMPGQNAIFARRLRELRFSGHLVATGVVASVEERRAAAGALEGTTYPDIDIAQDFIEKFRSRYGISYPPIGAANGYDAMKLLDQALSGLEFPYNRIEINKRLRIKDFNGALGSYSFSFDRMNTYLLPATMHTVGGTVSD